MRCRLAPQHAPGGELGARFDHARDNQGQDHGAQRGGGAGEQFLDPAAARRAQHRGHMTVRQRALDDQGGLIGAHRLVPEHPPQGLDARRGPVGEVGQGALLDLAALTPALTQQNGGARVAVGNNFHVHGNYYSHIVIIVKSITWEHNQRQKNPFLLSNQWVA